MTLPAILNALHPRRLVLALAFVLALAPGLLPAKEPGPGPGPAPEPAKLEVAGPDVHGWFRLNASASANSVVTLEATSDLTLWNPIAVGHDGLVDYPDPASARAAQRFYRVRTQARTPTNDWKNQVFAPYDAFLSPWDAADSRAVRWIKFAILTAEPHRVYFQDSGRYLFHYDFAVARFDSFRGLSRSAFDAVSLHATNQQVVLGAVLVPSFGVFDEFGIQFVGLDPYPPEQIARWFQLVQSAVAGVPGLPAPRAVYLPVYEQQKLAPAQVEYLRQHGVAVGSIERWLSGNHAYAPGWAIGRLKFIPAAQLPSALQNGQLAPDDILLTDAVPAEVPLVAGIISLAPSTPNSHVAILARSSGIPFVYIADTNLQARLRLEWAGRDVIVRAISIGDRAEIKTLDASGLDPALRAELVAQHAIQPIRITPKTRQGSLSLPVDNLVPADVRFVGGKAANFGILRRVLPTNSPAAIALTFDLWDGFMDQTLATGISLRAFIQQRLANFPYPTNLADLDRALAEIRGLIRQTAQFSAAQRAALTDALRVFDTGRKIRFRSSTNVEDTEQFTGAGLYDSYSGCLADELDNDTAGPSQCDPERGDEQGVFRAIARVFASFYNLNAYLERRRHGLDESTVGMAVLVHYSTPDPTELANGVATVDVSFSDLDQTATYAMDIVTQRGAISVANPDGNAAPEVVRIQKFSFGTFLEFRAQSSLLPLGAKVLAWEAEYRRLAAMFIAVAEQYRQFVPAKSRFLLDFEFKKVVPGQLSIKQVREIPTLETTNALPRFWIHEPAAYTVFQGEFGDVFSNHQLKSAWDLKTASFSFTPTNLAARLYTNISFSYLDGRDVKTLTAPPAMLPGYRHTVEDDLVRAGWDMNLVDGRHHFELRTYLAADELPTTTQILTLGDGRLEFAATPPRPIPALDYEGNAMTLTNPAVRLAPVPSLHQDGLPREREFITPGGVIIRTRYVWPPPPTGPTAGYTAPLLRWTETVIEGLTPEAIILRGDYSQTYRPGHHNFSEEFVFEPALEPGLAPATRAALEAANIRLIYARWDETENRLRVLGYDDRFRPLP